MISLIALTVALTASLAATVGDNERSATTHENEVDPTMEDYCRAEIIELHEFFEDWFNARLPASDAAFARFSNVMADGFEIIGPDGVRIGRAGIIDALRAGHGARPGISIEIRSPEARMIGDGLYLATYQEWQTSKGTEGDTVRRWISTALLRRDDSAPNGFVWLRVHETYLLDGTP